MKTIRIGEQTMMKFTMNAKELKTMMEKGVTAINKKAALSNLRRLYFQVEIDGTVKVFGTDTEHFVEIRSNNAWNITPGMLGIDIEDIKVLSKMNGNITLEDVSTELEYKINVQCGKKNVTIPKFENIDISLPSMDETKEHILTINESWLLETVINLYTFTDNLSASKLMQVYNFNTTDERVEALDGNRVGMRTLKKQKILQKNNNIMLHRKCMPVFKKIMDKKSGAEVDFYQNEKYIRVEGKDFSYIVRRVDGEYLKVNQILTGDRDYVFNVDREDMLSVMKYNCDIVKQARDPVVLFSENGKLYSYMIVSRYEIFDELKTKDNIMNDNLCIGVNPYFIADAFSIIDCDSPVCRGKNNKSPMFIEGNEYSFIITPMVISNNKLMENIGKHINKGR